MSKEPQFLGGPRDGESAATYTAMRVVHQFSWSAQRHVYVRMVPSGDYSYQGLAE